MPLCLQNAWQPSINVLLLWGQSDSSSHRIKELHAFAYLHQRKHLSQLEPSQDWSQVIFSYILCWKDVLQFKDCVMKFYYSRCLGEPLTATRMGGFFKWCFTRYLLCSVVWRLRHLHTIIRARGCIGTCTYINVWIYFGHFVMIEWLEIILCHNQSTWWK